MRHRFLLIFMVVFAGTLCAQRDISKEAIGVSMIEFHYMLQVPGQDMAERFGVNSSLGAGYEFKTKSNWIFGMELNYMFGQNIKNADSLLWDLEVHPGEFIISSAGNATEIRLHQRGVNGFVKAGKLFPILSPNDNSGFFVTVGVGYMGYKIRIDNVSGQAPIFADNHEGYNDYIKGYDRLTGGFALSENIGYLFLSNSRLWNFYIVADFMQGFTKNRRKYDFDRRAYTDQSIRHDFLYGARLGWVFTLYQRPPRDFYYD
ncbi:MAG: hypothetical protein FWF09_07270 [Bacteroidales bacterium]|nr:hypothetical protein [Bacteroidales bacterium]